MTPERYQQLVALFDSALEVPDRERSEFLQKACAGDSTLRAEVEAWLRDERRTGGFLEDFPGELAMALLRGGESQSLIGEKLGEYQLLSLLGKGGMGEVYLAEDQRLGRRAALKLLPAEMAGDARWLENLKTEARIVSRLNHPNIVTIYGLEECNGLHFLATEFVEGKTLRELIGHLRIDEVVEIARQMALGLAAAHNAGVVHRDIKPENVILRPDGIVKILDFGIAKRGDVRSTLPGLLKGTPAYMSPEQARGEEIDSRSDLFALGAVVYEMTTGQAAFEGETFAVVFDRILNSDPVPPREVNPATPGPLNETILKLMDRDRTFRYQSALELEVDLKRFRRTSQGNLPSVRAAASPTSIAASVVRPPEATPPQNKRPALRIGVTIAAFVILAVGTLAIGKLWKTSARRGESAVVVTTAPSVDIQPAKSSTPPEPEHVRSSIPDTVRPAVPILAKKPSAAPVTKPKPTARPIPTREGIEFVEIPPGEFAMGSIVGPAFHRPVHLVRITHSFELGKFELTQAQWEAVLGTNPSRVKGANLPVDTVSWDDVQAFILTLNVRKDGYLYRLPTEAEWEYACRAGTTQEYAGNLDDMGWYYLNSEAQTHPVGLKKPNLWGLYDMHGNVGEWVQDYFDENYYSTSPAADPQGPESGTDRVARGGNFKGNAPGARSAVRSHFMPNNRPDVLGFRLARTVVLK